jgi:hypothetical protein
MIGLMPYIRAYDLVIWTGRGGQRGYVTKFGSAVWTLWILAVFPRTLHFLPRTRGVGTPRWYVVVWGQQWTLVFLRHVDALHQIGRDGLSLTACRLLLQLSLCHKANVEQMTSINIIIKKVAK